MSEIVACGLDAEEIDELREWFCYTKPIGPSIKIVAMPANEAAPSFAVVSAGTEPGGCEIGRG